jgi:phosphopentomutase
MRRSDWNGRAALVVLDSVGIGEMPDAARYGDEGSNTLANTARAVGGLSLPHLRELGLGNIAPILGVDPVPCPRASYGKMAEASPGKDTTTGHWEMAGLVLDRAFATFPGGFPPEIIEPFEREIGKKVLGNRAASGTEIIAELGPAHLASGRPIVYTSADSVFQIAAHEEVIPLPELYRMCEIARTILDPFFVSRVIARPFVGQPGSFRRTYNRKDFSYPPVGKTLCDLLAESGRAVVGVGKIENIFAGRGITRDIHTEGNADGLVKTVQAIRETAQGLVFVNLIDFDMLYGHRNDPVGYARALEEVDRHVPGLLEALDEGDLLFLTADHGCDPTTPSTDHSREYVPLLAWRKGRSGGVDLGVRSTFADLGQTIAEAFGVGPLPNGKSFLHDL